MLGNRQPFYRYIYIYIYICMLGHIRRSAFTASVAAKLSHSGAKYCTPEIAQVKFHWSIRLKVHWKMPLKIHDDF